MSIEFWLFLPICCFGFAGWLSFRATLRRFTRFNGFLPLCVPFGDQKGTEKVPATSDSALPRNSETFFRYLFGSKKVGLMEESHNNRPCRKVGRAGQAANRTILAPHFHHFLPLIYPITAKVVYHFLTTFTV